MIQVRLIKPHTHAGDLHHADAVLRVTDSAAHWMVTHKVAKQYQEPSKNDSKKPKEKAL